MKAVLQKISVNHKNQMNINGRHSAEKPPVASLFPSNGNLSIQRSPSCPCGGGCPRCRGVIQPKLIINQPGDIYEQEADRVAEQVMQMPSPAPVSQSPDNSRQERSSIQSAGSYPEKDIQRNQPTIPPIVHEVLSSPGILLDPATRAYMEPRFGHDFSRVRVHSGVAAEQSARDMNAKVYTMGHDVVFGAGMFAPETH